MIKIMNFNVLRLSESVYITVLEAEDTVTQRVWDLSYVVMDSLLYFFSLLLHRLWFAFISNNCLKGLTSCRHLHAVI